MNIIPTRLEGVYIIEPVVHEDHRGFFMETYSRRRYASNHFIADFVQDNISFSVKNTLRGMHYQLRKPQAKLIQVLEGEVYDVAVDIRVGSPQFGQWVSVILSCDNKKQVFVPEGFAHGFCVLSEHAVVQYKCSDYYAPGDDYGILWADQDVKIPWPIREPILSGTDSKLKPLNEVFIKTLPIYKGVE